MILNQTTLHSLTVGFRTLYTETYEKTPSSFERIAMVVPSHSHSETYGWLGATTSFREWLGDRVIQNLATHDFTVRNRSFENTVGVNREDIEDDRIGIYAPLIAQLAQDARSHPDELVFSLLAQGWTQTGYDGVPFFSDAHPVGAGTASNAGGGSGPAWFLMDAGRVVKPLIFQRRKDYQLVAMDADTDEGVFTQKQFRYGVDCRVNAGFGLWQLAFGSRQPLSAASYEAARQAMQSLKSDAGRPLGIRPGLLVVPPALEGAALELLTADRTTGGKTNVWRGTAEVLVTPWLAS